MNLKNRFRLINFSMIALLVSIAFILAIGIRYTNMHIQEAIGMDELVVNLYELRIFNSEYIETPSERVKYQWQTKYDQIRSKLVEQQNIPYDVKDALNDLQQIFARLTSLADPDMETSQKRLRNQVVTTLNLELQRVTDWATDISMRTKDSIVPHLMLINAVMLAVMLVAVLVVVAIILITTRHILSSVNSLKKGAEEIARGKLGFQVEQAGNDEIATLATAINQMSRGLMDSYEDLYGKTVQLETEMAERQMIHEALKIKTGELKEEIGERMRAEAALQQAHNALEQRVADRTEELMRVNEELRTEITDRKRAEEELKNIYEQVRSLASRLQEVREETRTMIAHDIHDELGGALAGLKMDLLRLEPIASGEEDREKRQVMLDIIYGAKELINNTIRSTRRIIMEQRPCVLDDFGLVAAMEWQLEEYKTHTGISFEFNEGQIKIDIDKNFATVVFRIFQEALANVIRHSKATEVYISLRVEETQLILEIKDNGRGITEDEITGKGSIGILGMRERALAFGGEINIAGESGKGTTLNLKIPIQ